MAAARAWSVNTASTSSSRMAVQGMEAWSASSGFWTSESQCPAAQDPSQAALGHRATVEDHGDRRRNVTWQQGKEEAQRFDTARGCPDRDDVATNPFGIDHEPSTIVRIRLISSSTSTARLLSMADRRAATWASHRDPRSWRNLAASASP